MQYNQLTQQTQYTFYSQYTDIRYELTKLLCFNTQANTLRTGSFKLFKRPLPGFLTILTL